MHFLLTIALYILLAWHGLYKRSLALSGAVAAAVVCIPSFSHPSLFFPFVLLAFYISSSKLTKLGPALKASIEEDFKLGGQRTAVQVFSNGFTGTVIACLHYALVYSENGDSMEGLCFGRGSGHGSHHWIARLHTALLVAYLGHYACCNGDTWASEIGVFSKSLPRLITTFRPVPKGTNGGVSLLGLAASAGGGAFVGFVGSLAFYGSPCLTWSFVYDLMLIGTACGVVGSLIDSLLGATMQRTTLNKKTGKITADFRSVKRGEDKADFVVVSGHRVFDNHQVNFFSSLATAILAGTAAYFFL